jgi:hypothetical protein
MQSKMKFILFILLAFLFYSCASTPEPKDCSWAWDYYDEGSSWQNTNSSVRTISLGNETFRDRNCNVIPKTTFESIDRFVVFIKEHRGELDSWAEEQRIQEAQFEYSGLEELQKLQKHDGADTSTDRSKEDQTSDIKEVIKELGHRIKDLDKIASNLIPRYIILAEKWLETENTKKDKLLSAIEKKKSDKISDEADKHRVRPDILKMRVSNPEQWKECKESYKTYIGFIRSKIIANKRIPIEEQKKFGDKMKPVVEPMVVCRSEGYYTDAEGENIMGSVFCLQYFTTMPSSAKSQTECLNIMKPYSF